MLENIGLWVYFYTIVDRLSGFSLFVAIISGVVSGFAFLLYGAIAGEEYSHGRNERAKETDTRRGRFLRVSVPICAVASMLAIFVPTREDVKLIAGVVVGATVAEKTIETVSESELAGKVLDIVEKKIDNVLADLESTDKSKEEKK